MILTGFLSWIFFKSEEFSKFANNNDALKSIFKAEEEGESIEGRSTEPIKYTKCYEYFKTYAYDRAISCYRRELINNNNSDEIHYYLADSYYWNKNYSSALFHTNYIMKNLQNTTYAAKAHTLQKKIQTALKEKERLETTDAPDYYDKLKEPRFWSKMPIAVWIEDSENNSSLKNAFYTWQNSLYPTVSFKMVQNKEDANIKVVFGDAKKYCREGNDVIGCTVSYSYTNDEQRLSRATIYLERYDKNGNRLSNNETYGLLCHEIGHALGMLGGHSDNKSDVMYPNTGNYNTRPTNRDIKTVLMLYQNR